MRALRLVLFCGLTLLLTTQAATAGDPTWITMSQAITKAMQRVPGAVPFKAELESQDGLYRYEVLLFKNNVLYKVRVGPNSGAILRVNQNTGGGSQDKIAEAQQVIAQSSFTLLEAIDLGLQGHSNYYLMQAEMRMRDDLGVFHLELLRGPMKLEIEFRASDGVTTRYRLYSLHPNSAFYELYIGQPDDLMNVNNVIDAQQMIANAESRFSGATVYKIELYTLPNGVRRYQVDLFAGNRLLRTKFNASTGGLVNVNTVTDPTAVNRVAQSMANASISLTQAMNIAQNRVPAGFITEGRLRTQENGQRYQVELMTSAGYVEVRINSATGGVMMMWFDN